MENSKTLIKSVDRAMQLLSSYDLERPELSVCDLAAILDVHESTASRLAATLGQWGVLQRNPENGKYRLGIQLVSLAGLVLELSDLATLARPQLVELRDLTSETVNLAVMHDSMAVNVARVSGSYMVSNAGWVGRRYPLHCTAAGKAFLAYLPRWKLTEIMDRGLARFTANTICDGSSLLKELETVRSAGYAVNFEEFEIGLCAVAAPVWNLSKQVEATLCVSGPIYRMPRATISELGPVVRRQSMELSKALGGSVGQSVYRA